jgi:3-oxoacyl-[acyl-carrier-protein] synthase II
MESVVITGMGVVSPLGSTCEALWKNLVEGASGIKIIPELHDLTVTMGGPAHGFDPTRYLGAKELRHLDRYCQMAVTAGMDAYEAAALTPQTYTEDRIGIMIGTGAGGLSSLEEQHRAFLEKGPRRVSPLTVPMFIVNMAAGMLAVRIGAKGPGMDVSSACATGGHALALACRLIQSGDADCMIAGGIEACLTPFAVSAFAAMKALSTRNDEPEKASRPFDRDRDGFVMAEGGAVMVLETYTRAKARGARILAKIAGIGMTQDAYHMVAPDPEASAVVYAMQAALNKAGISPEDIGYINAHGTSTPLNDKTETLAIKKVFGQQAYQVPVSSTKSMTGHLIGGAAGLETAICVMAMQNGMLPPTINLDNPDPECDLDYIPGRARARDVRYSMNNAFAFGGQNICLVLEKGGI